MSSRSPRLPALPLLGLLFSACSVQTPLSEDALVSCADGICPTGWACNTRIGLCRPEHEDDDQPPLLTAPAALTLSNPSYPHLALGGRALLSFQASEPLRRDPVVVAGEGLAFTRVEAGADRTWRYELTAEAGALQQVPLAVSVRLVDLAGNESGPIPAGTLVFDYQSPGVVAASVGYLPSSSNPLGAVTKAAAGTTVSVELLFDEPLALEPAPTLAATNGTRTLGFTLDPLSRTELTATFTATVPPGLDDSPEDYLATVTLTDRAGNPAEASLPSARILVKTRLPRLLVDQSAVSAVSSPSGDSIAEPLGEGFSLPRGPYAELAPADSLSSSTHLPLPTFRFDEEGSAPPVRLRFWRHAEGASPLSIGEASSAPEGWPRLALNNPATDFVFVTGLDAAGNESEPVGLAAHEWVATTARAGTPTASLAIRALAQVPVDAEGARPANAEELAALASFDGATTVAASAAPGWREWQPSAVLPSLTLFASAFDAARGRVVLFGGKPVGDNLGLRQAKTWEFDGIRWADRTPTSPGPAARTGAAMVFDAARNRTVLFGGETEAGPAADTWEWNGREWREIGAALPGAPHPGRRTGHAMAWDAARRRLLLFGGTDGSELKADTWTLADDAWTPLDTGLHPSPPARRNHAITFDPGTQTVVLYGGRGTDAPMGDTWTWDGTGWTELALGNSSPGAEFHALAYDGQGILLVSADSTVPARQLELWTFREGSWTAVPRPRPGMAPWPTSRSGAALAFDPASGRTLIFGGPDAWFWDGASVVEAKLSPLQPPAHDGLSLTSDADSSWLYSGSTSHDLWRWNGHAWEDLTPADPVPMVNVPDSPNGGTLASFGEELFFYGYLPQCANCFPSGFNGLLWRWNGAWSRLEDGALSPRVGAKLVGTNEGLLLVGGASFAGFDDADTDTWAFSSGRWAARASLRPGARTSRSGHAVAFDPRRERVVVFGGTHDGSSALGDTWEWDGKAWSLLASSGPPARLHAALSFERSSGRVVLAGGVDAANRALRDVWEWDGATWRQLSPLPWVRMGMGLTDSAEGLVLFGGNQGTSQDTWLLPTAAERRPAFQFSALLPEGPCRRGELRGVRVRANAGGQGGEGRRTGGVELFGWSTAGGWTLLDSRADLGLADPPDPALPPPPTSPLDWSSAPGAEPPFLMRRDCRMAFQLRPLAASAGPDEATLALDYLEVRVRYSPR